METMASPDAATEPGVDFGWMVHDALDSWTGKVDTKASIVLAIETAVAGFVIAMSSDKAQLAHLKGWHVWADRLGLGLLVIGIVASLLVVMPQLRAKTAKREWRSGIIYFGHLRRWDPADLAKRLDAHEDSTEQLAKQMVQMADIAWWKHVFLQWSLLLFLASCAALFCAGA
jgi:hypothetical protein